MRFRALALIIRLGFAATAGAGSPTCLSLAYLARCARAIFRRTAALRFFRGLPVSVRAVGAELPPSIWRISAIRASMRLFWTSNPCRAAERMSAVTLGNVMSRCPPDYPTSLEAISQIAEAPGRQAGFRSAWHGAPANRAISPLSSGNWLSDARGDPLDVLRRCRLLKAALVDLKQCGQDLWILTSSGGHCAGDADQGVVLAAFRILPSPSLGDPAGSIAVLGESGLRRRIADPTRSWRRWEKSSG